MKKNKLKRKVSCSYLISDILGGVKKKFKSLQLLSSEHFLLEEDTKISHTFSNMARYSLLKNRKKGKEGRKEGKKEGGKEGRKEGRKEGSKEGKMRRRDDHQ